MAGKEIDLSELTKEQREELETAFEKASKAQEIIATYDQARVDRLAQAVAWSVANKKTFLNLVEMSITESGLGDPESRQNKRFKIRGVLRDALRQKSDLSFKYSSFPFFFKSNSLTIFSTLFIKVALSSLSIISTIP